MATAIMPDPQMPMVFADIHCHILFGVDDGARSEQEMLELLDAAYHDGTRELCFTPHYHPAYFGASPEQIDAAFQTANAYVSQKYPDLHLYLGSELRYEQSFSDWLKSKRCRTLNGTEYLLADFLSGDALDMIVKAMLNVINCGYRPVLAHVERYEALQKRQEELRQLKTWGTIFQIDAQSLLGGFGYGAKKRSRRLLEEGMVDLIASDAHDMQSRSPDLRPCYYYIVKKYGQTLARRLFYENPMHILRGEAFR